MSGIDRRGPALRSGESEFALLRLDRTNLIVPRNDVRIIELAIDLERDQPPPHGIGWILFDRQRCPVYCPSMELEWMDEVTDPRPICAVLTAEGVTFGLLCSEAKLLRSDDISFHDLPPAMVVPGSPVHRLAVYEGGVACASLAARIFGDLPAAPARVHRTTSEAF
jgi:hypothetical protein